MSASSTLERNLLALVASQPDLASRLQHVAPSGEVVFLTSRSGALVPARRLAQRPLALHSTVDPLKEGRRYLQLYEKAGYLVFLGLGAGYQVLPFLSSTAVSRLLLVEADAGLFRAVLERVDLCPILADPRVRLELDQDPQAVRAFLLADYLPAIHGDLRTVPLHSAIGARQRYYAALAEEIRQVIGSIADDYTVQARFGRRWFFNTLANLPSAQDSTVSIPPAARAVVTGAGPSLEHQVQHIPRLRAQGCLIASDTSLPALLAYGIVPDLVISIDCQQISYHHFLQGIPPQVPLVLDLASPPLLARLGARTLFFASNHPLSRLLAGRWRPLPSLDASGGNVSHAAVSLALQLGAKEIHLLGTDFSYPEGKAYSRGSYIYPLFRSAEHRLRPLEGQFFSFILKGDELSKERIAGAFRYTTRPLIGYRDRLQQLADRCACRIVALPGKARCGWREFLSWYVQSLESLPAPSAPVSRYLASLPREGQALWATLFPAAACFREARVSSSGQGHLLLRDVRDWSVGLARRFLDR